MGTLFYSLISGNCPLKNLNVKYDHFYSYLLQESSRGAKACDRCVHYLQCPLCLPPGAFDTQCPVNVLNEKKQHREQRLHMENRASRGQKMQHRWADSRLPLPSQLVLSEAAWWVGMGKLLFLPPPPALEGEKGCHCHNPTHSQWAGIVLE